MSDSLPRQLSTAQWQALLEPAQQQELARYTAHLRTYHTRWKDAPEDALLDFTRQHMAQAQQNGSNNDRDAGTGHRTGAGFSPTALGATSSVAAGKHRH
ncbi:MULTISPECIES: hypothetical protein [Symbiopectobacterium]|uniref:hypothetical protein n=1 Tax=Symbiopectobacterium TaxID=801 RepID=UPI00207A933B|nr:MULTISPECIES: hypothetical protein [Symbiopectobacterium]